MNIKKRYFGYMPDGKVVTCWELSSNNGIKAEILDYGVTIRTLVVPDRNGKPIDVVLGYDDLESYLKYQGYLGGTIGRFANRIGNAVFELNGKEYHLAANNGVNHLHGGNIGFDKVIWHAEEVENGVMFFRLSSDGEEGYPGNLQVSITVSLVEIGLKLHYHATTDQDTIVNLTNHTYFNLNGDGNVKEHFLKINANQFSVTDEGRLPTGELRDVNGTAMDFREFRTIGERADSEEPCVKMFGGYDVNMVLTGENPAIIAYSEKSGILMQVITDQPGVQLYTSNNMMPRSGKLGQQYGHRSGFCLETQHFPDCIHHPEWPTCILRAGEIFESTTMYFFETK